MRYLSLLLLLTIVLPSKLISFAEWNINFWSYALEWSTLKPETVIIFKRSPFNLKFLFVARKVNNLSRRVTGIISIIIRSFPVFNSALLLVYIDLFFQLKSGWLKETLNRMLKTPPIIPYFWKFSFCFPRFLFFNLSI